MSAPALAAEVVVALGTLQLQVWLSVAAGETVAVVGPNGAGKTTLLRVLAGLVPVDAGSIVIDGREVDGGPAGAWVPPQRRPIGLVFQDHRLFPHLRAVDNVAFGLRCRGVSRRAARAEAVAALERLGVGDLAGARPTALSGGQAQRVALARALVLGPTVLLLDEPLAALDATTRQSTRQELSGVLRRSGAASVLVTHDVVDAASMADRIVVLEQGQVTQEGRAEDLAARPRSAFVADLVGVNLLTGRRRGADVVIGESLRLAAAGQPHEDDADVLVMIHPRAVTLSVSPPAGTSSRNVWPGEVRALDVRDGRVRARLDLRADDGGRQVPLTAEVTPAAAAALSLREGTPVWASVKASEIAVYPG